MIDFDLEYPLEVVLEKMLDKREGHIVGCMCKTCITLEVMALQIMKEEDIAKL